MHYLAVCCIAKDEDPFLKEWLAYHALLGVEHFYLYDNLSAAPIRTTLGAFADNGMVTIRRVPGTRMQLPVYDDCLASFGPQCRWIGFLDIDEFACPMRDNDLRVVLSEFEPYGGLAATWHLLNSSGHLKRPEGPVLKNYTEAFAAQESYQIKSFVQPARTVQALSPHNFRYKPGWFCANEDHLPVSPGMHCTFSKGRLLRINHYFMRSQQDFEEKLRRGRADATSPDMQHEMVMFLNGVQKPYVEDREIQRFLPRLEKALKADALPRPAPLLPAEADFETVMETAMAFQQTGQAEKALACLCCANPEYGEKGELWTLRALLASQQGRPERSEIFARQALAREASAAAMNHLRVLLRERGQEELAEAMSAILKRYPEFFV